MKANDLMVGDYVLYDGLILKVGALTDYDIKIDLLKGNEIYAQFWDEDMDNIQGIPLTPEILAKNGFEYSPFSSGIFYYQSGSGSFSCTKSGEYWLFFMNENIIANHFHYVHELQHALRLCGIDKEIVL